MDLTTITGWSDSTPVFQRYGEIALGAKNSKGLPESVNYFVVPPEVAEVYGNKPTVLDIEFPSDDLQEFMPCGLYYYNSGKLLVCKGNGQEAAVKAAEVDLDVGLGKNFDIARKESSFIASSTGKYLKTEKFNEQEYVIHSCLYSKCPYYKGNIEGRYFCHELARLQFILPKIPGRQLGVYTLETSSYNTYQNVRNGIGYFRRKYPGLPLWAVRFKLRLQMEVKHPEIDGKKQATKPLPIVRLDFDMPVAEVLEIRKQHLEVPSGTMTAIHIEPIDDEKMPELLYGCGTGAPGEDETLAVAEKLATGGAESPSAESSSVAAPQIVPFKGTIQIIERPSAPVDVKGIKMRVIDVVDQDGQKLKWLGKDEIIASLKINDVYDVEGEQAKDTIQVKTVAPVAKLPDGSAIEIEPEAKTKPATETKPEASKAGNTKVSNPLVVELSNDSMKEVPTAKGVFLCYRLCDGGIIMIPKGGQEPKPGSVLRVTGIETRRDNETTLWAKTFESVA